MSNQSNSLSRKSFGSILGGSLLGLSSLKSASAQSNTGDSKVIQLYKSMNDEQKSKVCLPLNDTRKTYINNWWYVHKNHRIRNTFSKEQVDLIYNIFDNFHNEEYQSTVRDQVVNDMYGRINNDPSIGFFGQPGDSDFEFIYTGHHVTRRCDGNTDQGKGFNGPIFYGTFVEKFHETKDHPGNPYWFQSLLLNDWISKLTAKQQKSLIDHEHPRSEKSVYVLEPSDNKLPGLSIGQLSQDLQNEFLSTVKEMLRFFRKDDVDITLQHIKPKLKHLHLACYSGKFDIGSDKVYDTWQMEAPGLVWYHRGVPHIHAYFNLDLKTS